MMASYTLPNSKPCAKYQLTLQSTSKPCRLPANLLQTKDNLAVSIKEDSNTMSPVTPLFIFSMVALTTANDAIENHWRK